MRRNVFEAIADPTSRAIPALIAVKAMTPTAIAEQVDSSRQAISRRLRIPNECRLLKQEQSDRDIFYHFDSRKLKAAADRLEPFQRRRKDRFKRLDQVLYNLNHKKMNTTPLLNFSVDRETNKIQVERTFSAGVDLVWQAWTRNELLDQWWAPRPWKAETKSMNFTEGGSWHYAMSGPEGEKHWAKVDFVKIEPLKSITLIDAFSDENGNPNPELPASEWKVSFEKQGQQTVVKVQAQFEKPEDLDKIIEMGFEEGFTLALGNLEEMLTAQLQRV